MACAYSIFLSHRLRSSKIFILFSQSIDFSIGCLGKEVYDDDCWKGANNMAWGHCIPIDSVKSGDDYSYFDYNNGIGACVDSDETNLTYLVG